MITTAQLALSHTMPSESRQSTITPAALDTQFYQG